MYEREERRDVPLVKRRNYYVSSSVKRSTLIDNVVLFFSVLYGVFMASYVNNHFILDSGDIMSLVETLMLIQTWMGISAIMRLVKASFGGDAASV